jgi:hypothetical protein
VPSEIRRVRTDFNDLGLGQFSIGHLLALALALLVLLVLLLFAG